MCRCGSLLKYAELDEDASDEMLFCGLLYERTFLLCSGRRVPRPDKSFSGDIMVSGFSLIIPNHRIEMWKKSTLNFILHALRLTIEAPPEMVEGLKAHLAASAVKHEVEWYPGTHHGFAFRGRGSIYDKEAAERHWSRLFALFARNL